MATEAIVCDIDDTLIDSRGNGINKTIEFINDKGSKYRIILVTARNNSIRDKTVQQLKSIGVSYDQLIMNPGSSAPGAARAYKKAAMERILKSYKVALAIDNSSQARSAYQSLGVKSVHPRNLNNNSLSKSIWDGIFNPIGF